MLDANNNIFSLYDSLNSSFNTLNSESSNKNICNVIHTMQTIFIKASSNSAITTNDPQTKEIVKRLKSLEMRAQTQEKLSEEEMTWIKTNAVSLPQLIKIPLLDKSNISTVVQNSIINENIEVLKDLISYCKENQIDFNINSSPEIRLALTNQIGEGSILIKEILKLMLDWGLDLNIKVNNSYLLEFSIECLIDKQRLFEQNAKYKQTVLKQNLYDFKKLTNAEKIFRMRLVKEVEEYEKDLIKEFENACAVVRQLKKHQIDLDLDSLPEVHLFMANNIINGSPFAKEVLKLMLDCGLDVNNKTCPSFLELAIECVRDKQELLIDNASLKEASLERINDLKEKMAKFKNMRAGGSPWAVMSIEETAAQIKKELNFIEELEFEENDCIKDFEKACALVKQLVEKDAKIDLSSKYLMNLFSSVDPRKLDDFLAITYQLTGERDLINISYQGESILDRSSKNGDTQAALVYIGKGAAISELDRYWARERLIRKNIAILEQSLENLQKKLPLSKDHQKTTEKIIEVEKELIKAQERLAKHMMPLPEKAAHLELVVQTNGKKIQSGINDWIISSEKELKKIGLQDHKELEKALKAIKKTMANQPPHYLELDDKCFKQLPEGLCEQIKKQIDDEHDLLQCQDVIEDLKREKLIHNRKVSEYYENDLSSQLARKDDAIKHDMNAYIQELENQSLDTAQEQLLKAIKQEQTKAQKANFFPFLLLLPKKLQDHIRERFEIRRKLIAIKEKLAVAPTGPFLSRQLQKMSTSSMLKIFTNLGYQVRS